DCADPARQWFAGEITDSELVDTVADNYARFISIWHEEKGTP
ncbi:MAG: DUF2090 domain-containing protein, partial [Phycisphaeraceae bacterium]|nr:DUF2090 domain-containing protein [Phycisphaeraceae bacterium]